MSQDIEKDTYIKADTETRAMMTHDLLASLDSKLDQALQANTLQVKSCNRRFDRLERRKKLNTAIASGSGVAGGVIAVIVLWLKGFMGK